MYFLLQVTTLQDGRQATLMNLSEPGYSGRYACVVRSTNVHTGDFSSQVLLMSLRTVRTTGLKLDFSFVCVCIWVDGAHLRAM